MNDELSVFRLSGKYSKKVVYVQAESLQDVCFDIQRILRDIIAERIAQDAHSTTEESK